MVGLSKALFVLTALVITGQTWANRHIRDVDELQPGNWDSCKPGSNTPPTRVDTSERVMILRNYFATNHIEAYLVPSEDAHQSEYPSEYDKRRAYISGFAGSAGFAVITVNKQALWTDGRYFLEAEDTLDCNWILMRMREKGVPTIVEWVKSQLTPSQRIGVSPYLLGSAKWKEYAEELSKAKIVLQPVNEIIDIFWRVNRPPQPNTVINALPLQFAGRSWPEKIGDMRSEMEDEGVDMMVVTSLDETAWLFNLRGSDIEFNPFFISYAIIEMERVRLYILAHEMKLTADPTDESTTVKLHEFLNTGVNGSCAGQIGLCVEVLPYVPDNVARDVRVDAVRLTKVWISPSCNYKIYSHIPESKLKQSYTPISIAKAKKNTVEIEGMKTSHIRDAVALISFITWLQKSVTEGEKQTELSAAAELTKYRSLEQYNRGLSFETISSYGSNGAIIHYGPSPETDKQISTDSLYLLDSGGQYLDGTTDVTRTFHFGNPTDYQKECYTRVLMGHIDLFQAIWPKGLYGYEIDAYARGPLWQAGLIYRHGTGHGIGAYLSVHEGPGRIGGFSKNINSIPLDETHFYSDGPLYMTKRTASRLDEFQFISNEPGYYEDGQFGIRLENIVIIKNATTKYNFPNTQFLAFDHVTLVPYEPKLIDYSILSKKQLEYLKEYNQLCRTIVGKELKRQGKTDALEWLLEKTEDTSTSTSAPATCGSSSIIVNLHVVVFILVCLLFQ